ncbi:hypothetical protein Bca52824_046657 [Brassica carinata]|uniref:Uncharacterized protein n=1 Tax=Brassica carinata TaxID=52824 RepID=A0A8X7RFQ4_BRACI|nr:hypothetical protein Bca52824_046657 [Brassica carinata]
MWDFAGVAVLEFSGEMELEIVNPTLLPHDRPYRFRLFHFSIFERTAMPQNDGDYRNRSVSIAATSMFTAIIELLSTLDDDHVAFSLLAFAESLWFTPRHFIVLFGVLRSLGYLLSATVSRVTGYRNSRHTTRNNGHFLFQNLESRGSSHHFNCGNPTLGQLAYHYMAVKFKRINSSLTGKRLFVSLSLDPNRAPSLKLAMENPKWTEGKTSICMSEYSMYIT